MTRYEIKSDADYVTIEAQNMDDAARIYASTDRGLGGVTDLRSLLDAIEAIDGAWLWIQPEGDPGQRMEEADSSS